MIVLSLIFVIVAAVLLVAGFFQSPGLELIWSSIAACVLAMIFLGIGVLQRRRSQEPASAPGGYGAGSGESGGAPAPARPSATRPESAREPEAEDEEDEAVVRKVTAEERAERTAAAGATTPAPKKVVGRKPDEPAAEAETTGAAAKEVLAEVKGLGPAKQDALLERFGSLEAIKAAPEEELLEVKGFGPALAGQVKQQLAAGVSAPAPAAETTGAAAKEVLAEVKGLGPAKQDALLERFGSLEAIKAASEEQLREVKGFGAALARQVKDQL